MGWGTAVKAGKTPLMTAAVRSTFSAPTFALADINFRQLVTLDFETYFDTDYTLRKMSTSEYIRDERFKAHMVGIKIGLRKTKVVPANKIADILHDIDWTTHDLLCHNTAFDGFILSHHYGIVPRRYYDTLSMARGLHSNDIGAGLDDVAGYYGVGNKIPEVLGLTLGVKTLPKSLYTRCADYCAQDVNLCLLIFMQMLEVYPASEIALIDMTIRMFCDPVLTIDRAAVKAEHTREVEAKKTLLRSIVGDNVAEYETMGLLEGPTERALEGDERLLLMAKRVIGSSKKFADLLREAGVEPGVKISPAWVKKKAAERDDDKKWSYAFAKSDIFMQELLASENERVRELAETRISVKSTGNVTKAQRFLNATENNWKLPMGLSYYRAHTGRFGGNNKMNVQNMKRGGILRESIYAQPGWVIVVKDSSQIECRMNGWLWGQSDLMEAFRVADIYEAQQELLPKSERVVATGDNRDAYCRFADSVYGREITKADKTERFVGKVCVLGLGYQMGAPKLRGSLAQGALGGDPVFFEEAKTKEIVNLYRRRNNRIVQGWEMCTGIIQDMAAGIRGSYKVLNWEKEKIWLPNGMCLKYPGLKNEINEDTGWDEWTYVTPTGRTKIYGGLLTENIVQALARIVVTDQMLAIGEKYRIVTMTHDEIVVVARKRSADTCDAFMQRAMMVPPAWCADIPLNCEGGWAANYSK
jgi:hypothetical protein